MLSLTATVKRSEPDEVEFVSFLRRHHCLETVPTSVLNTYPST